MTKSAMIETEPAIAKLSSTRSKFDTDRAVLGTICSRFQINSVLSLLRIISEVTQNREYVDVAILGSFNSGKSSFLNSLLQAHLLPVAVVPLTAIITRICYGENAQATVFFMDGTCKDIPLVELADYVTERENPKNQKGVAVIDVFTPRMEPFRGIRFIDTPGLGSAFLHNTQTSMDWLPNVGVAILALSVEHAFSEDDKQLLKKLTQYSPEVCLLITKIDLVLPEESQQVEEYIAQQLGDEDGKEIRLFQYSRNEGYEMINQKIVDYLRHHVSEQHVVKTSHVARHKFHQAVQSCREYLKLAQATASAKQEALQELISRIAEERRDFSTITGEMWQLTKNIQNRLRDDALEKFLKYQNHLLTEVSMKLKQDQREWRGNLTKLTEHFNHWLGATLSQQLEPISLREGELVSQQFLKEAEKSIQRLVRSFQDRMADAIFGALQIRFGGAQFSFTLETPQKPDIRIGKVFDFSLNEIWFLIPMVIFRPLIHHHFQRLLPWEINKNLHRLSAQWVEAIGKAIDSLTNQAQGFILDELNTIEKMIQESDQRLPEIEEALQQLEAIDHTPVQKKQ